MKKRPLSSNQQVDHRTPLPIKIMAILTFPPFPSFTGNNKRAANSRWGEEFQGLLIIYIEFNEVPTGGYAGHLKLVHCIGKGLVLFGSLPCFNLSP
ncbi:hypothetical protein OIU76_030451 [Salix suchowensis]|nr:hypothetical protein OIU76_030451 [Salix suchowensis]KAJ6369146.1 hypothetical protein OIU78_001506 [Salix suchowensis]